MTSGAGTPADLRRRIESLVGERVESLDAAGVRGFMADHFVATLASGVRVFVKHATTDFAKTVLKGETLAYAAIGHQPFVPTIVAYDDDLLIIEDLACAHWPPPWRDGDLERVQAVLHDVSATSAPDTLRELGHGPWSGSWSRIAGDPAPLLGLDVCSAAWLDAALPRLVSTDGCPLAGHALVHGDLRSDNLCLVCDKVVLVDWAAAARGRPDYDLTTFAIATATETALLPEHVNPAADPALVAAITSVLACHAPNGEVPRVIRQHLEAQLRVALPWCARLLDLPAP